MVRVDEFNAVVQRGLDKTVLPQVKKNMLGMTKVEEAVKAVEVAAKNAADSVGQEILATYNKAKVINGIGGNHTKVESTLDGITSETYTYFHGEDVLTRYSRTTTKGTYTIDYDLDGTIKGSGITLPNGKSKYTPRIGGKHPKLNTVENTIKLEEKHNLTRGRAIEVRSFNTDSGFRRRYGQCHVAKFENGNVVNSYFDNLGNNYLVDIILHNGDQIEKLPEAGVTRFRKALKNKMDGYFPSAYHINPKTGERSETTIKKGFDSVFNREVVDVEYKIAPSAKISVHELKYSAPTVERGRWTTPELLAGKFESATEGKVELKGNRLFINDKEQETDDIFAIFDRLDPENKFGRNNKKAFELLLQNALENDGVSKELFLPSMSGLWHNM